MAMTWSWLERWLLPAAPPPEPPPEPPVADAEHTERMLAEAEAARREFERLKRRARALGIEVDITRSWGPRREP